MVASLSLPLHQSMGGRIGALQFPETSNPESLSSLDPSNGLGSPTTTSPSDGTARHGTARHDTARESMSESYEEDFHLSQSGSERNSKDGGHGLAQSSSNGDDVRQGKIPSESLEDQTSSSADVDYTRDGDGNAQKEGKGEKVDRDLGDGYHKKEDYGPLDELRGANEKKLESQKTLEEYIDDLQERKNLPQSEDDGRPQTRKSAAASNSSNGRNGKSPKRASKKKSHRVHSIEDLYLKVSTIKAHDDILAIPTLKCKLTPRSQEACLKHGVNAEALKIRDLDSFWEPGVTLEIQKIRHEAYSKRRHELMRLCRIERKKIINAECRAAEIHRYHTLPTSPSEKGSKSPSKGEIKDSKEKKKVLTSEEMLEEQANASSTLIQMELKRIEKMRRRQEKELEGVIEYEVKMTEIQNDMKRRMEGQKRRDEARKKEEEMRRKRLAEERRIRELRKKARLEAEEERRQEIQRNLFKKSQALKREQDLREREMRKTRRHEQEERARKTKEYRMQTERILRQQQNEIMKKFEEMKEMERKRREKLERRRKNEQRLLREKQQKIQERLQRNMEMSKKLEEKRRNDFYQKQNTKQQLRDEASKEREFQRQLHLKQLKLQEKRRHIILKETREEEEKLKEQIIAKLSQQQDLLEKQRQERGYHHRIQKERNHVMKQLKIDNVERIRRVQEYSRIATMKRIHRDDERVEKMLQQRQELIKQRRDASLKVKMQKDNVLELMEKAKKTGVQGVKQLKKALASQTKKGPNDSSTKKMKKKRAKGTVMSRSQSASAMETNAEYRTEGLGPRPESHTFQERINREEEERVGAKNKAYISPYEAATNSLHMTKSAKEGITVEEPLIAL